MNKNLLRSKMALAGDRYEDLARYIGISLGTFQRKINEKDGEFSQSEISMIKQKYLLTDEETIAIFFSD